jgi:hypothetical protein
VHPQKRTIKIADPATGDSYSYSINLEKKRIELILKKPFLSTVELIIGEVLVPDLVQIRFYKELQILIREHQTSNPKSSK